MIKKNGIMKKALFLSLFLMFFTVNLSYALTLLQKSNSSDSADVILIADNLAHYQIILDAARPESHVMVYNAARESSNDVMKRVIDYCEFSNNKLKSLSIFSHGGPGYFELGNDTLTLTSVNNNEDIWYALKRIMTDRCPIYIYGCDVANASGNGRELLDSISRQTGAPVYASNNLTGIDGDWELEVNSSLFLFEKSQDLSFYISRLSDYPSNLQTDGIINEPYSPPQGGTLSFNEDYMGILAIVIFVDNDENITNLSATVSCDDAVIKFQKNITEVPMDASDHPVQPREGYSAYRWIVYFYPQPSANHQKMNIDHSNINITVHDSHFNRDYPSTLLATVLPINDAPVLAAQTFRLTSIDEDQVNPPGQTVGTFTSSNPGKTLLDEITDVDTVSGVEGIRKGIAVIEAVSNMGTWEYRLATENPTDWKVLNVSETSATLLDKDDYIRFIPAKEQFGEAQFRFRAWDGYTGTLGQTGFDASRPLNTPQIPGDTLSVSENIGIARISITPQNDCPQDSYCYVIPPGGALTDHPLQGIDPDNQNASPVDDDILTFKSLGNTAHYGDITIDEGTGTFSYVPNPDRFVCADYFTYQILDGDENDAETCIITATGFIISGRCDIDGDGLTGLEEAIHALQISAGIAP